MPPRGNLQYEYAGGAHTGTKPALSVGAMVLAISILQNRPHGPGKMDCVLIRYYNLIAWKMIEPVPNIIIRSILAILEGSNELPFLIICRSNSKVSGWSKSPKITFKSPFLVILSQAAPPLMALKRYHKG